MTGSLTIEDGLSDGNVYSIFKDSKGYIWLGNTQGVDRYDGSQVVNILFSNDPDNIEHNVYCITEENGNFLLIGNKNGLWRLDKIRMSLARLYQKEITGEVTCIRRAGNTFYIGTRMGLFQLQNGRLSPINLFSSTKRPISVKDIFINRQGRNIKLYVALEKGVAVYNPNAKKPAIYLPCYTPTSDKSLTKIVVSGKPQNILVGTTGDGILCYDAAAHRFKNWLLQGMSIPDMMLYGKDRLLAATSFIGACEIRILDKHIVNTYTNHEGNGITKTRYESPICFYRDYTGTDWLGYKFFGLDYTSLSYQIFHTYQIPGRFNSNSVQVRSFLRDGNRILLGTRNGLLVTDRKKGLIAHITPEQLHANIVTSILRQGDHYLVGTIGGGLHAISATSLQPVAVNEAKALASSDVFVIRRDTEGQIWIASTAGLTCISKSGQWHTYTSVNSQLPDNEVYGIVFDKNGKGWIITKLGLCNYLPETHTLSTQNIPKQLSSLGRIITIVNESDSTLIFSPVSHEMVRFNINTFKIVPANIIKSESFPALLFMKKISSNSSLYCLGNMLMLKSGSTTRIYDYIDGLENMDFQSNAFEYTADTLWAGTNAGLTYVDCKQLLNHYYSHIPIVLQTIITNHLLSVEETNRVNYGQPLRLNRLGSGVEITFAPLVFGNSQAMHFRYRLKGFDKEWHTIGMNRFIVFSSLPAGEYTLEIEAIGRPEVKSSFKVSVPYSYKAIASTLLIIILLSILGYLLYCHHFHKEYFWKRFIPQPEKYQRSKIDKSEAEKISRQLKAYMKEKKPYLKADLTMGDVAKGIGCSTHSLSQVFSQYLNMTYYDFIADYRIQEFKDLLKDPGNKRLTITALSEKCGFRSRTSFVTSFKKITGMTPKEYMKGNSK